MTKRRPAHRRGAEPTVQRPRSQQPATDTLRPWLLGVACALVVVRPLFPSESATSHGDGSPVIMLWLAVAVIWLLGAIGNRRFSLRFGWLDAAVLLAVGLHTLAALWAVFHASPRPALNVMWEWIGYALLFLGIRQFAVGRREGRALVAVMIGLAVALSAYGLYQYFYEHPRTLAEYEQNPDEALRKAGLWYPEGSRERGLFYERLKSREPVATFALTNSLAGYLAPWLVVLLGIGVAGGRRKVFLAQAASVAVAIALCLVLTKSRAGVLATAFGVLLVAATGATARRWLHGKMLLGAAVAAAGIVAVAVVAGGLDREVLSEAGKSLGYRLQYWESSLRMIGDHPWIGCGPGNFQQSYPRYMLETASEEVADPHNFVMEIWATAGTPAMLALVGTLVAFLYVAWRRRGDEETDQQPVQHEPPSPPTPLQHAGEGRRANRGLEDIPRPGDDPRFVYGGAVAGFLLSWPIGMMSAASPSVWALGIGLPMAAATVVVLARWVNEGPLPALVPAIGAVVLLVNLLAAGALSFPAVAGTLWLLLALGLNRVGHGRQAAVGQLGAFGLLATTLGLVFACYLTGYGAVVPAQGYARLAADYPLKAEHYWQEAQAADPLDFEPRLQLSGIAFARWQFARDAESFGEFERYAEECYARAPEMPAARAMTAERYLTAADLAKQSGYLQKAIAAYRQAVERYPTNAGYHASLALALRQAGEQAEFVEHAETALRLDEATPHKDRKLPDELRNSLRRSISERK